MFYSFPPPSFHCLFPSMNLHSPSSLLLPSLSLCPLVLTSLPTFSSFLSSPSVYQSSCLHSLDHLTFPLSSQSSSLSSSSSPLFLSIFVFCLVRCLKCPPIPSPSSSSPLSLLAPLPRRLFLPLSHLSLPPFVTFVLLFLLFPAF